jgi:uncharacterized protein (TIGR03663 family)
LKQPETEPQANLSPTPIPSEDTTVPSQVPVLQDMALPESAVIGETPPAGRPLAQFRNWRLTPPTREQLLAWLPFWGVILLGAVLRFWGLGDKPLHHDESLHAYYSLQLLHNTIWQWGTCATTVDQNCYVYSPWLHGPFQFHAIALVYQISQWLGAPDNGVNTTTVRIAAATLGTVIVGLPYFLRDYLGKLGAWLACFLLAISPGMVYFSRFAREDIYYACFTLLMVVATLRYARERRLRWLLLASASLALSYATKETTFLTVAIFGAFAVGLIVWELGLRTPLRDRFAVSRAPLPRTFAPLNLLLYLIVLGVFAKIFFGWLKDLSIYITTPAHATTADAFVQRLKDITVILVPLLSILLGFLVLRRLLREQAGKRSASFRSRLAARIDSRSQRLLDTLLAIPWLHWFYAFLLGWMIFLVLYTALFTNIIQGIGDGIWQGLYYWLQQQQVDRGGEPWYYYLLLIPLYEQIGVVFGLIGLGRSLLRPTRFRLFLVVWFLGSLFLYSWAAEKMPWLMIHIVVPMLLLAALGLEPCLLLAWKSLQHIWARLAERREQRVTSASVPALPPFARGKRIWVGSLACLGSLCAVLLLIPTLQNMYQVSYVHPADSQHEMMVYVQTTVYVNTVMDKIAAIDQQIDGGRHQLRIGVMNGVDWPFEWYLRDYPNTCFDYPSKCPSWVAHRPPVILAGDDDNLISVESQLHPAGYASRAYVMRGQFDQGYMPPLCIPKPQSPCDPQPYWGVGPGLWLSYGDNPPPGAHFNPILAFQRIWSWWWQRTPFGSADGGDGGYNMELFIAHGIKVAP